MRGPRGWPDFPARLAAFRAVMSESGLGPEAVQLVPCRSRSPASGYEAAKAALTGGRPTALFCLNDATAIGALRACREARRAVPRDVSVVGFDDGEFADVSYPPLTTIRQPRYEMGIAGAKMLMELKRGEAPPTHVVLPVELVVRESTCPARTS
jgi:DNA-binding LacI/PurR family transcriptional regulator